MREHTPSGTDPAANLVPWCRIDREKFPDFWGGRRTVETTLFVVRTELLYDSRSVVSVFARTSSWAGSPEVLARWADHAALHVAPFVTSLPGNTGCLLLLDAEGGHGLTLTLWDSAEAALESDRMAEQSRAKTVAATGVHLVERGRYEVVAAAP